MSILDPTIDAAYREYADALLRRHRLLVAGKENESETEDIEDRLTDLWEQLDEVQRRSLNGIGSDLNWVRRAGALAPKGRQDRDVAPTDKRSLAEAEARNAWHETLYFLRVCAPALTPTALARARASAYEAVGLPELAVAFRDFAAPSKPRT